MTPVSGVVLFVIIWWVVLFAVLPFGTEPDPTPAVGMAGAPKRPRLGRKALWTTAITVVIWAAICGLILSDLVSFRELAN